MRILYYAGFVLGLAGAAAGAEDTSGSALAGDYLRERIRARAKTDASIRPVLQRLLDSFV